jgi:hypothetical protein
VRWLVAVVLLVALLTVTGAFNRPVVIVVLVVAAFIGFLFARRAR